MRRFLGAIFLGVAAAGTAALAQTAVDPENPVLIYRSRPSFEVIDENFPNGAYNQRLEGYAELCCLVRENGTLACAVIGESPAGLGFGEAARRVASEIRLTEESAAAWRERGGPLRVPINFRQPRFEPAPPLDPPPRCGADPAPAAAPSPEQPQPDPVVSAQG